MALLVAILPRPHVESIEHALRDQKYGMSPLSVVRSKEIPDSRFDIPAVEKET